ncbi:hypothetical protein G9A89_018946 [Geosiphon pyriformis]|nr:hypothetical protein G9A89_018946 [Geosiphon pyriformis]
MKKTPVGEIDNFPFTLDEITISVKVLIMDAPQYQALTKKPKNYKSLTKDNMPEYLPLVEHLTNAPKKPRLLNSSQKKKPIIKTFMALGSMSNWADETEQEHFTLHSELETSG